MYNIKELFINFYANWSATYIQKRFNSIIILLCLFVRNFLWHFYIEIIRYCDILLVVLCLREHESKVFQLLLLICLKMYVDISTITILKEGNNLCRNCNFLMIMSILKWSRKYVFEFWCQHKVDLYRFQPELITYLTYYFRGKSLLRYSQTTYLNKWCIKRNRFSRTSAANYRAQLRLWCAFSAWIQ